MMNSKWLSFISLQFCTLHFAFCTFSQDIDLNGEWQFKKSTEDKWYPATVPGVVHTDFLANKLINDPYWENQEEKLRWIENEKWIYKREFSVTESQLKSEFCQLEFDGLDTYAEVYINGKLILKSNNMFIPYTKRLISVLKTGKNTIEVHFIPIADAVSEEYSKRKYDLPAGCETVKEKYSPYVRKAAYHFGWDWGPRFVTAGIFRDVRIRFYEAEFTEVYFYTNSFNDSVANVAAKVNVKLRESAPWIRIICEGDTVEKMANNFVKEAVLNWKIKNPKLWWCNGEGEPHLYEAELQILNEKKEFVYSEKMKFGLKKIELINEKDSIGTSFYFKLNGKPVFIKGANYIPQDVFLPRVSDDQYEKLILKAKNAGMNMLRVWGGGVYEKDLFYDLCDKHGIMVWQDFMFAGSLYPSHLEYDIADEAELNVKRLRNHPCIAIWCGNNEIDVAWKNWGWQKQFGWSTEDSTEIWNFQKLIFHEILPGMIQMYDPQTPYTPTSPLSNWGKAENFNHSSMHYWGVWHGGDDFEDYNKNVGRFMVEYGFQSFPSMKTIKKFASKKNWSLDSEVMKSRQKSYIGNKEISRQIEKYYGKPKSFEEFVERSQDVQAKALEIAIKAHLAKQPHCMGTMFWQFNDCWPGPSWSVIDYFGEEKKAYQVVKDLFLKTQSRRD